MKFFKIIIYILVIFLTTVIGFFIYDMSSYKTVTIKNVTKKETLILHAEGKDKYPSGISIKIESDINGTAVIYSMLGDKPYRVIELEGKDIKDLSSEWYSDTIILVYEPNNVKSGKVTIEYKFEDN